MVMGNYVIMIPGQSVDNTQKHFKLKINKNEFERLMNEKRPYLNPKLRITDLATYLNTNRTYLSIFINQNYGMSFSRYINGLRMQELERLRLNPEYIDLSEVEIISKAGFSNYRGYVRYLKTEKQLAERPFLR